MNSDSISQRIWQHSKATGVNKLMLLALAQHADINKDNDGFCWPSYQTLGGMVGLTGNPKSLKRNAIRNLAPLIKAGEVITWEQQGQEGGRGYTNIYLITVGLTNDQIKEIIQRRFKLEPDEVGIALSKVGVKYDTLCSSERVSIKTLIETRVFPKGDKYVTHKAQELNKGDKGDTRLLESSSPESNPKKESERESHAHKLKRIGEVDFLAQNRPFAVKLSEICGNPGPEYVTNGDRRKLAEASAQLLDWDATIDQLTEFRQKWKFDDDPWLSQVVGQWGRYLTAKKRPQKASQNGYHGNKATKRTNPPLPPATEAEQQRLLRMEAARIAPDDS